MPTPLDRLQQLVRPRLLVGAARFGLGDWRRDRDLCRLLRCPELPSPGLALSELLDQEAMQEEARCQRAASYVIARHVELLAAVMAEARLAQARDPQAPPQAPPSDTGTDHHPDPVQDQNSPLPEAGPRPAQRTAGGSG